MLAHLLLTALVTLPAQAAPSGLDIQIRGADSAKPIVILTNNTGRACQVVTGSPMGTIAITRAEQDGEAIQPLPLEVSFPDGLETLLTQRLQTVEPGKAVEVPLAVVKAGPTGTALEMVTWSRSAGTFGMLYPIAADKPLKLELTYSAPVTGDGKTPICTAAMTSGTAAQDAAEDRPQWLIWAAAGGALILLAVVLVVLLLLRRKRRAAAAVILLVAATLGFGAKQSPAYATITGVDPSIQSAFDNCMTVLRQPGNDPAGILPALDAAGVNVSVQRPSTPGDTHESALDGNTIFIFWDPDHAHRYHGSGGNSDPCTSLYHELHHGWQHNQGTYSMEPCATSDSRGRTLPRTEVEATHAQNLLRERLGLPQRSHYGDIPLPSDCRPPERPERCTGASCGDSNGDPHLLTFDNKRYDFQAVGEFVLARQASGGYEVQVRQQPAANSRLVSLNTSVAMAVGSDKVEVKMTADGPAILVGGVAKKFESAKLADGEIKAVADSVTVSWKDGPKAFVRPIGRWGLHVALQPSPAQAGKLEGLLGDYDGDSKNDIKPRGGSPIAEPTFAALYPSYADSWRIDAKSSLFTYDPGASTDTYTDRKFPDKEVKLESLPGRAAAEALCRRQGITDPQLLAGCILDVALTGQADFAAALATGQIFVGGEDFGGIPFTVRLAKPDDKAVIEFDGTAGQQIFVDVPVSTLRSSCGTLHLRAPDGKELRTGCIINGIGHIDSTTLPTTGKYTVTVEARGSIGEARLRIITIKDVTGTLTPDGPPISLRLDKPGMVGRFTFTGKKDQKVYVDFSRATLRNECGLLGLRSPTAEIRSGCIINGVGELDGTVLPVDGTYTVEVDPNDRGVGDVSIKLINAIDLRGTITVGGATVTARIQQSGAQAFFTFSGTAGQRIFVDVLSSTLPNACGVLDLKDPDGGPTVSGCIIAGKGGIAERDGYVLKKTGIYTIVVDPRDNDTGTAELRLRG